MTSKILKKVSLSNVFIVAFFVTIIGLYPSEVLASDYAPGVLSPTLVDEVRIGVHSHDLAKDENGVNLNAEILFRRPNVYYDNKLILFILNPRFHIGGSVNTAGDTSQGYVGATWDYRVTEKLFIEASFGGVVHDGNLTRAPGINTPALGCRVMFRESASAGFEITQRLRVMATIDHISNASLCKFNDGLTTVGARVGYKF